MRGGEWLWRYGLMVAVLICMLLMADGALCVRA